MIWKIKTIDEKKENSMSVIIPKRFQQAIDNHLVGNMLALKDYPLMLSIFGEPGVGKTFQLRKHLADRGFNVHSINAADLESDRAGEPTKLLRKEYINASAEITNGKGAAIVIDDIDTTMGEWEKYTGTVNHQDLIAFFMHIADSPTEIEHISKDLSRVPVFFTGNDFDKLYDPLRRPGRMNVFKYSPTIEEKCEILCAIFGNKYQKEIQAFVERKPNEPISFFSSIRANVETKMYAQLVEKLDFQQLVSNEAYKTLIKSKFYRSIEDIDWPRYFI